MAAIELGVDLTSLLNAVVSGNSERIISVARELLQQGKSADVVLGRIGLITAQGDPDGHPTITVAAAAMLARLLHFLPAPLDSSEPAQQIALPLFAQTLISVAPAVQTGNNAHINYPKAFFPSKLVGTGKSVNDVMREAVIQNDAQLTEGILLGLYGTGADYRTMQVRAYEALSTTFQDAGHPLLFAVRGFQVLDAVEWGDRVPAIIHWLAPHIPLRPNSDEPAWVKVVQTYTQEPTHSVTSIRTRLSAPKNENALLLRQVILGESDTAQVCQGVYDALLKGEASPRAVASVIALAAADILQKVGDENRELFITVAHGLLFAAATRQVFQQVQDVEVLGLLFTSAAYINALQKEVAAQITPPKAQRPAASTPSAGGGLIAVSQLETLGEQLKAQDLPGAYATAQRYLKQGHDPRALFGTIGLAAALINARVDQGHTLQIVQAAAEEYMAWPISLAGTNIDAFLQIALRAALFGQRDATLASVS